MGEIEQNLVQLFTVLCGSPPISVTKLPGSGSYRSYYRILGPNCSVIGAHNDDVRENDAFIAFTNHFKNEGLPVPEILANDREKKIYLITDLGDATLYNLLTEKRPTEIPASQSLSDGEGETFPTDILDIYKKSIAWLPIFQVLGGKALDYSVCYPRAAFDRQSMMWDLNYFKYYFLKLAKVPFDEQALEEDFSRLCDFLLKSDSDFFLYRDFQSRNIMVLNGEPWFIDYQGGRKGALQYDIASLLTDGKADIPMSIRNELLQFYLDKLGEVYQFDCEKFLETYYGFALIRILQALGAYGFRGYYENKSHFLLSIPFALRNLRYMRENKLIGFGLKTLMQVIDRMTNTPPIYNQQSVEVNDDIIHKNNDILLLNSSEKVKSTLTVSIYSFSYKRSIPVDENGNGGGFVFDCRALPNPGRFEEFRKFTGKDQPVIDYLKKESAVSEFLGNAFSLVDQSVKAYTSRDFEHLMVAFGCTGGQHRSVYCAEELAKYLESNFKVNINLSHIEQENPHSQ